MREMIRVRETGHELRVQVLDGRAYVAIVATDRAEDPEAWTRAVSLPARRLYALVRAAWADDQYGTLGPLDPPLRYPDEPPDGPEPEDDLDAEARAHLGRRDRLDDRLGERADPSDMSDVSDDDGLGDLLPFPGRSRLDRPSWDRPSWDRPSWDRSPWERSSPDRPSWSPPWRAPARAPRSGLPWSAEDDAALREAWLGADPATDRAELMRGLAARFERTTGGVLQRLHRVGCDPASPGTARDTPAADERRGAVTGALP